MGRRYADTHGLEKFFDYRSVGEGERTPPVLSALEDYRRSHLGNHNPLVVNIKAYGNGEEVGVLSTGLFVSGKDDYRLKDSNGIPVLGRDLLCFKTFLFRQKDIYKSCYEFKEYESPDLSCEGGLKELLKMRKALTTKCSSVVERVLSRSKPLREGEEEIRAGMRTEEGEFVTKLEPYTSGANVFLIQGFRRESAGVFAPPLTLPLFFHRSGAPSKEDITLQYFPEVVQRIFGWNVGSLSRRTSLTRGPAEKFRSFLVPEAATFCKDLFGRGPLDNERGVGGCFESEFDYYFMDSEQVFIKLLEDVPDVSSGVSASNESVMRNFDFHIFKTSDPFPSTIERLEVEFLSPP